MQLKLREFQSIILFTAVAIAGLLSGGIVASFAIGATIVVTIAFTIIAFVGRGELRSSAIGFIIPACAYAAIVFAMSDTELDPFGRLPTTRLFGPVFELIVKREWEDLRTGQPISDYDFAAIPGGPGSGPAVPHIVREAPDRYVFMLLAHAAFAMLFGYLGSKFAVCIDRMQSRMTENGRS
ncbi:MAG: hypothetical protein U0795_26910 [Pirellulales bacterium]